MVLTEKQAAELRADMQEAHGLASARGENVPHDAAPRWNASTVAVAFFHEIRAQRRQNAQLTVMMTTPPRKR